MFYKFVSTAALVAFMGHAHGQSGIVIGQTAGMTVGTSSAISPACNCVVVDLDGDGTADLQVASPGGGGPGCFREAYLVAATGGNTLQMAFADSAGWVAGHSPRSSTYLSFAHWALPLALNDSLRANARQQLVQGYYQYRLWVTTTTLPAPWLLLYSKEACPPPLHSYGVGAWNTTSDTYLGFRKPYGTGYRYGWVRFRGANVVSYAIQNVVTAARANNITAFSTYPNPTTDGVQLTLAAPATGSVVVHDLSGRELRRQSLKNTATLSVSLAGLPAGSYVLEVISEPARYSRMVTKW